MDLERALHHLCEPVRPVSLPDLPATELSRSPAAARVGALAGESELFLFHAEHRVLLPAPDAWVSEADVELAQPPVWDSGVLPEAKYQAFRHDLPLGSFHPGHRAKWSTHELCHGLVGFAWRPDASPLFHATAGRLAELVPVVLWYFLDEIGLRRCPRHTGPLFRAHCPACERAAAAGPTAPDPALATEVLREAARFVDRELAAVARTRRLGLPCPHVWGSIDLCSDGVAYAASHGLRLTSDAATDFADLFLTRPGDGFHAELDALEERALAVLAAIAEGAPLAPWTGGRARWVAWDLAQRLLQVGEEVEGEVRASLVALAARLAEGEPPVTVAADYATLALDEPLPTPEVLFAVGYAVDGLPGRSVDQVREGLGTVCPLLCELEQDAGSTLCERFVAEDRWERVPLGDRFASWLERANPGPAAWLARFEASLRTAGGEPEVEVLAEAEAGARWVEGTRRLRFPADVPAWAEAVERGEVVPEADDGALVLPTPGGSPTALVIGRDRTGELVIADVPADLPERWVDDASVLGELVPALAEVGLVAPERYRL
ncbi:MAG: hypothetical protein H6735_06550 [Alphaproteobacteria bacterium]|nr:hypothetical protein [Alphaproteobacteria bacterium]